MTDDVALMGHLMRRAAFGAPAAELEALAERGYDAVVDDLLHPERFDRLEEDLFDRYHWDMVHFRSGEMTAARWFYRMVNSSRPLEEKTALLWHGIFATGGAKVTINTWMSAQIDMFRDYGLGSFRELLVNLSRDPAMIYWLDNQTNHSDAPNENYGRELLELFSMGVGNYSEDDVKQCARAFTGWSINQMLPRYPYGFYETKFVYRPDDHDDSVKEFLGAHGAFDGEDVVDVIVRNPATADFIARKLYNFFVSDTPDEEAQAELAQAYFDCDYEIRGVLRHLFHADWFKEARFKKVRSPSETVATTIRLAGLHRTPREYGLMKLPGASEGMGQTLLNPPTVEGWHTGKEWIDTAGLVERVNFIAEKLSDQSNPGVSQMVDRIANGRSEFTTAELLESCAYEVGGVELEDRTLDALRDHVGGDTTFRLDDETSRARFGETASDLIGLIGASREFQLQ